jgi:hypothetical protein
MFTAGPVQELMRHYMPYDLLAPPFDQLFTVETQKENAAHEDFDDYLATNSHEQHEADSSSSSEVDFEEIDNDDLEIFGTTTIPPLSNIVLPCPNGSRSATFVAFRGAPPDHRMDDVTLGHLTRMEQEMHGVQLPLFEVGTSATKTSSDDQEHRNVKTITFEIAVKVEDDNE